MKKTLRCYLLAGLALTVDFTAVGQLAKAGQREPTLTVTLHVINYAEVPENTLIQAEQVVTNIFHQVGVETVWFHIPVPSAQLEFLYHSSALDLKTSIASRLMVKPMEKHWGPQDDVFGLSTRSEEKPGHVAYVFYHRVEEFVRARNLALHKARILGLAIAHEIGHLLLPLHSHSSRGVMRATWDREDFELAARGNLDFTPKQAELIRSEVLRRSALRLEMP